MENLRPAEQNKIKDVRSVFRLEKLRKKLLKTIKTINTPFKVLTNLFRLNKENKAIKDRILRDIRNVLENEEGESYYKLVRVSNFWIKTYIEYESNGNKNEVLSVEEYLNKIRLYLKDIINNLKKSNAWKFQLTMAINFLSSIDNDEGLLMHLKSDNKEIVINDGAGEVIINLFKCLKSRYQNHLESIRGIDFFFDYVRSLYYKCRKINTNRRGSYIGSPDWIKNKKATIYYIN